VFAVLQFADVGFGWQAREILGRLQREPDSLSSVVRARERPFGLSLTAIIFSYHLAAAYITANLLYRKQLIPGRAYAILVVAMLVMAAANGTRSLLIGIVLHEVVHQLGRASLKSIVTLGVLAVVAFVGMDYLASVGSRVATINDASAVGRWTLYEYGMQLVRDNPFGYGWDFNPGDYAWLYWEQLSDMARAEAAFRLDIHNAFLNFVLLYGIYGVLIVALTALFNPGLFLATAYFAVGYLAHSFFHNDGVFLGDDYFWFAFVIFVYVRDQEKAATGRANAYAGRQQPFALTRPGFSR
jgi:O-antigen ligase